MFLHSIWRHFLRRGPLGYEKERTGFQRAWKRENGVPKGVRKRQRGPKWYTKERGPKVNEKERIRDPKGTYEKERRGGSQRV